MKYESIIFDIDGTLWDSRALVAEGYNVQLERDGLSHLSVDVDDMTAVFGLSFSDLADKLFPTVPVPERYALVERCMATENDYLRENPCEIGYPGVKETIAKLAQDHRLFIVSNSECGYPQLCMEKLGIGEYIQDFLCYGDTRKRKGLTIRMLMERNKIENAIYIGDTQGDYLATVEADLPFLWCTYGFGKPDAYVAKVDSFEELLALPFFGK